MANKSILEPHWEVQVDLEPSKHARGPKVGFAIVESRLRPGEFRIAHSGEGEFRWHLGPIISRSVAWSMLSDLAHGYKTNKSPKQLLRVLHNLHVAEVRKRFKRHRADLPSKIALKSNDMVGIF